MANHALLLQRHYGAALAVLTNKLGSLESAEDALQEASIKALKHWGNAPPDNAAGWLVKVGFNHAIDNLRREQRQQALPEPPSIAPDHNEFEDSILQLIFMCCHPSLAREQQIALTLKMVMGFHQQEIARAFLLPEKTLEQRITRAKRKLKQTAIEFALPASARLKQRLPAVLQTLYLIFNEGYHATRGDALFSRTLCQQAIRLLRSLCRMYRAQASSLSLLALMLFIDARATARTSNEVITLEQQDRSRWHHGQIQQADILLQKALTLGEVSHYSIEAAIAGLHCLAKDFASTDWQQICLLYQKLNTYQPSPVVLLNQAVAHMMAAQWPQAEPLLHSVADELQHYPAFWAAQAKLDKQKGLKQQAVQAYANAIQHSNNQREKAYFLQQQRSLGIS